MSTNAIVKFYLNGKTLVGKEVCINKLKSLLDGWSLCEELVPISNDYVKDAGDYWYEDFAGYVEKGNELEKYVDLKGEIHLAKDLSKEIQYANPSIDDIKAGKYYKVFKWKKETNRGQWFNSGSFCNARLAFENQEKKYKTELSRLEALKNTIQYYTLKEDEQQHLEDDISFNREMLEDTESKIYICQYMIDIMETMADMYGENYNDFTSVYVYFA